MIIHINQKFKQKHIKILKFGYLKAVSTISISQQTICNELNHKKQNLTTNLFTNSYQELRPN